MSINGFSRRDFMGSAGLSVAAGVTRSGDSQQIPAQPAERNSRPKLNLILFMPDELRADALSCYGNPVCRTPNLDRLASEGTQFSNCHVQYPVCGASRCSLLTGWPVSVRGHRSLYYFLRPEEPNLFRYLKQNGYDVFWYGKNDALAAQSFAASVTEWNYPPAAGAAGLTIPRSPYPMGDPMYFSFLWNEGGSPQSTADYRNVEAGIRILEQRERGRPFCIFLPLSSPHPPYAGPKGFHDLYDPAKLPPLKPIGLPKKPNFYEGIREAYGIQTLPESTFRKIRAVYLGMVSYTDWLLGVLLEAVERTNHAGNTAIFALTDHGDYAGDYGLVEKWPSGLEDDLTHIPVIARVPGAARGHVAEEMVELFDVMATCLELADVEAEHTHFARSLLPQIQGGAGDPDRAAFSEGGYNVYEPQCFEPLLPAAQIYAPKARLQNEHPEMISRAAMVRTRTHKLILRPQGQSELYDYRKDPQDLHNLYGESSTMAVQQDLERRLAVWYLNTTGIAPFDKDQRNAPPFIPTPHWPSTNWHRAILDESK